MTRSDARQIAFQLAFSYSFNHYSADDICSFFFEKTYFETLKSECSLFEQEPPSSKQLDYVKSLLSLVIEHSTEFDKKIESFSKGWPVKRIDRTARVILWCAICEIEYFDSIDPSVSINEAVIISKKYMEPRTVSFVNGILGQYMANRSCNKSSDKGPNNE
jgi:N utilization substance protein B